MTRYLDPKNDLVFKKVFDKRPRLLISFLNAVMPLPSGALIETLEYLSPENVPDIPNVEKRSVVDVRCFDQNKRHFIVEMQMAWSKHFMQRFLFNTASVYVRQLKITEKYESLNPVYGLAIVASAFSDERDWFHHYRLVHAKNNHKTVDDFQLVLLELPKFEPKTLSDKKLTVLWLRFLTEINEETTTVDQALLDVPEIKEALTLTEEAAYTPAELEAYSRNWDAIKTQNMLMNDKLAEGFEKGREEGREEGREKLKEREQEIAHTLLSKGLDVAFVADSTGLDFETVKKIHASLTQPAK